MKQHKHGFTITELLVVIAIVSMLVAFLLPAVMRIRKNARMMYCQGIMRSLGQGYMTYANDWKGAICPMDDNISIVNGNGESVATTWSVLLEDYGKNELASTGYGSRNKNLVQCPTYQPSGSNSYAQNPFVGHRNWKGATTKYPLNFSHIDQTSDVVLMGEHPDDVGAGSPGWWNSLGLSGTTFVTPHFGTNGIEGRANFLYCDGHVSISHWKTEELDRENFIIELFSGDEM